MAMIKTMLVPVGGAGIAGPAFAAATWVARLFTGHMDFLFARQELVGGAATEVAAAYLTFMNPGLIQQLQAAATQEDARARQAYHELCEAEGIATDVVGPVAGAVTSCWHREIGDVTRWTTAYGRAADLLVMERPRPSDALGARVLAAALLDTGRPVLIPGSRLPSLDRVAIAWKPTREAARAVAAAQPFILQAKRLSVLWMDDDQRAARAETERVVTTLRRHQSSVETFLLQPSRDVGAALLLKAQEIGAGLLVMGAYGHGRTREIVFGGVTQRVLGGAEIPVLMAH
jgi:nucleotide-binding universal stress UspA family protein